jgi:hypothetical protein
MLNHRTIISQSIFLSQECIEKRILAEIIFARNQYLIEYSRYPYGFWFKAKHTLKKQIFIGFGLINELLNIMVKEADVERVVAKLMLLHYLFKHSSLLAAYRIQKKQPISEDIVDMFKIGFQTDATSSRLKLASVLCCNSEYDRSLQVLNEVRYKYFSDTINFPTCLMYISANSSLWNEYYNMSEDTLGDICSSEAYSFCVEFKRKDIWCCPLGLRRSVSYVQPGRFQDIYDSYAFHRNFGIELDSNVVFHYLGYLTYSRLAENKSKITALKELTQTVIGKPKKWSKYFFEIANIEDLDIIKLYREKVLMERDFDVNDPIVRKHLNNFRVDPYRSIRECLRYAFERNSSSVQHVALALILIGYSFELENKIDFASAFYWFSFIIDSEFAADQHLLRICPLKTIRDYFIDFNNNMDNMDTAIELEIKLIPVIVEAFVNLMRAYIYIGLLKETEFQESTYRARCYVCLLNALVKNADRQNRKPLEVFLTDRQIVQAERQSILL